MIKAFRSIWLRFIVAWVSVAGRAAWLVLFAAVLATGGSFFYAAENLGINTSTTDMLSKELRFRQVHQELKDAFPVLSDNITIVVDGKTPDVAEDAAKALAAALRRKEGIFNFVFTPADEPFFKNNGLLYLDEEDLNDLSEQLAAAQPLLAVLAKDASLRGLFAVLNDALSGIEEGESDPESMGDFFGHFSTAMEEHEAGKILPMSWRQVMEGGTPSSSDLRHFILAQPNLDYASMQPASEGIDAVRKAIADLGLSEKPGVRVRLTGGVVLDEEELQSVSSGASIAGVLSFFLVGILVVLGLQSWRLVLATLVTLFMGLVWTAGYATLAVGQLNLISVAFAVLFIGIGVDFGIQFSLRYREGVSQGLANDEALRQSAKGIGGALSLAALSAAIGFFAFVPTAYAGLSELGVISGGGMFIALFANLTVLPALLTLMPLPARDSEAREEDQWGFVRKIAVPASRHICRHCRVVSVGALVTGLAAAVIFLPNLRFDFDPMNLKDPSTESVETALDLMAQSETSFYTIMVMTDSLEAAQGLAGRIEEIAEVDHVRTFADYLPTNQGNKLDIIDGMATFLLPVLTVREPPPLDDNERLAALGAFRGRLEALIADGKTGNLTDQAERLGKNLARYEAAYGTQESGLVEIAPNASLEVLEEKVISTLPARLEALRAALDAREVGLEDLPETLRKRNLAQNGEALIEVFPTENLSDNDSLRRFVDAVRQVAPDATDSPVMLLEGGNAVTTAFKQAGALSLTVIFILLVLVLQSLIDALLVLMPLALAALLTAAASVLFNIPLNFANIIAVPLLFSLGVAYGLYFVLRERETASVEGAMATSTPRAILFSALTTMGSFGTLLISSHQGTSSMGQLLAISLTLALVCTLLVLPALVEFREQMKAASEKKDATP